jgi:hypothetical protein
MQKNAEKQPLVKRIARIGLTAKGIVYVLLGTIGFMAAFEMGGKTDDEASRSGVLRNIKEMPGGEVLLGMLAGGLLCYSAWRCVQTFSPSYNGKEKNLRQRVRYFYSGMIYLLVAFSAGSMLLHNDKQDGDSNQHLAAQLLDKSFGQWLTGIAALLMAGNGVYQLYYGLSEKYKKHVQKMNFGSRAATVMLRAGKVGYVSRGIVWLITGYLLMLAALHFNSSEAGDTGKVFGVIENLSYGSYLLGLLAVGLVAYGCFNFVRAKYETFGN